MQGLLQDFQDILFADHIGHYATLLIGWLLLYFTARLCFVHFGIAPLFWLPFRFDTCNVLGYYGTPGALVWFGLFFLSFNNILLPFQK